MERRTEIAIKVKYYTVESDQLDPCYYDGHLCGKNVVQFQRIFRNIISSLEKTGITDVVVSGGYLDARVECDSAVFVIEVDPQPYLSCDFKDFEPLLSWYEDHVWFIHSIDVGQFTFKTAGDADDYVTYLIHHNYKIPSEEFVRSSFHKWLDDSEESYDAAIEFRKDLIAKGELDPEYLYKAVPLRYFKQK